MHEHVGDLEEGVEPPALEGGLRQALERARDDRHHHQEDPGDDEEHGQRVPGQLPAQRRRPARDEQDEQRLQPFPEEDRALQRPPEPRDPVAQRARRHARVGDVPDAEVAGDQEVLEGHDGEGHEGELGHRRAPRARRAIRAPCRGSRGRPRPCRRRRRRGPPGGPPRRARGSRSPRSPGPGLRRAGSWTGDGRARLRRGREPGFRLPEPLLRPVAIGPGRSDAHEALERRDRAGVVLARLLDAGLVPERVGIVGVDGERPVERLERLGVVARQSEDDAQVGDGVDVALVALEDGGVGGDRLLVAAGVEARVRRLEHALEHLLRRAGRGAPPRGVPVPWRTASPGWPAAMSGSGGAGVE